MPRLMQNTANKTSSAVPLLSSIRITAADAANGKPKSMRVVLYKNASDIFAEKQTRGIIFKPVYTHFKMKMRPGRHAC